MCKLQYRIIPVLNIQSDCVGTWDIHNLPSGVWGLCTAALTRQMFCTFHILPSLSYVCMCLFLRVTDTDKRNGEWDHVNAILVSASFPLFGLGFGYKKLARDFDGLC